MSRFATFLTVLVYPIYYIYKYIVYKFFNKKEFIYDTSYTSNNYISNDRLPKGVLDSDCRWHVVGYNEKYKVFVTIKSDYNQERDV